VDHKKRNTLALKGISIILGLLLWLFVTNENVIVTRHTVSGVSVKAENLGAGLKVVYNDTVDLEISGNNVDRGSYQATVDLSGMGAGKHQVPVQVKSPTGVKLVKVVPAYLTVNILKVDEKLVPVEVRREKEPPQGFRVAGRGPSPGGVLVRGGYSDVLKVAKVRANIDLSTVKEAATLPLTLVPVDREGQEVAQVSVVPKEGQVYVVVEADKKEVSLPIKVEVKGALPVGYTISTEPAQVKAFGSQEVLSQLTEVVTEPLEVAEITESFTREVKLAPVAGMVFNPASVMVRVEIKAGSANP